MGQRHARVLGALPERFEIVGAFDVKHDRTVPAGVPAVGTEAEAVARADVVVVATPIAAHAPMVARALAAGRHVLVEKPLCATGAEADALLGAAARTAARLFVGHSERFNPVVRSLARLVRRDQVVAIDLERVGPFRPSDHGVLVNLGVHDFDLAAYLGGGHAVLRGAAAAPEARPAVDELAHVLLTTAS